MSSIKVNVPAGMKVTVDGVEKVMDRDRVVTVHDLSRNSVTGEVSVGWRPHRGRQASVSTDSQVKVSFPEGTVYTTDRDGKASVGVLSGPRDVLAHRITRSGGVTKVSWRAHRGISTAILDGSARVSMTPEVSLA